MSQPAPVRHLTRLVGVRLAPEHHAEGLARAAAEGTTLPTLMRNLLLQYLARSRPSGTPVHPSPHMSTIGHGVKLEIR